MFTWVIGPKGSFAMPRGFLLRILQEENPGQKLAPDRSETPWEWPIFPPEKVRSVNGECEDGGTKTNALW